MALSQDQQVFISALVDSLGPKVSAMVDSACAARMGNGKMLTGPMAPATGGGGYPTPGSTGPTPGAGGSYGQNYPGQGYGQSCGAFPTGGGGFIPSSFNSWCNIKCDPCLFSNLALDVELYSWPLVEPQLYATDTKLNNVVVGAFPLAAGGSLTISQETDRTIAYIPDCVQVATTWTGPPQPGLLTYQWQMAPQDNLVTGGQIFGNIENGQQYECGSNCIKVPWPSYKGCSGWPVGSLAAAQLIVSLDAAATSTLTGMLVAIYHKRSVKINNCGGGCDLRNGSCGCG